MIGIYLFVVAVMDFSDGIAFQDGGVSLHVDVGQFSIVKKQVGGNLQRESSVRVLLLQRRTLFLVCAEQFIYTGDLLQSGSFDWSSRYASLEQPASIILGVISEAYRRSLGITEAQ